MVTGNIQDVSGSDNGELFCTISDDKSLKVFDIVNFGKSAPVLRLYTVFVCNLKLHPHFLFSLISFQNHLRKYEPMI